MKISGDREHIARLKGLTDDQAVAKINAALFVIGSAVAVDAQVSITNGDKNGAIYTHEFATINGRAVPVGLRPNGPHQASAPGEAPANDTGQLAREIEVTQPAPLKVEVAAYSGHAVPLEFGTSKMEPRPFMRPAAKKNRAKGLQTIRDVVSSLANR